MGKVRTFDQNRMKLLDFVEGNAKALEEEAEAIKGVFENNGTVIMSTRFRVLSVN